MEFRHLIEEQDPIVGQADLARLGNSPPSDEACIAGRMVGVSKRPGSH